MSEADRAPLIHLSVDQEVFVDTVRDGDVIEDATVATEVTSFDRVGDAYVLEGAIVFAGYLTREGSENADRSGEFDSLSIDFDEGQFAKHVHHRMPFVLRVPMKSQPRGLVNVASRIAAWNLEVIGAGWIRVVADLSIVGLNGSHGYHFQCGAQEAGDLFFDSSWDTHVSHEPTAEVSAESAGDAAVQRQPDSTETEAEVDDNIAEPALGWMRSAPDEESFAEPASGPRNDDSVHAELRGKVEELSSARGGHATEDHDAANTHVYEPAFNKDELLSLDKAIDGTQQREAPASEQRSGAQEPKAESQGSTPHGQAVQDAVEAGVSSSVTEYEFEHQVTAAELSQVDEAAEYSDPLQNQSEDFIPSRSFSQDEFHATAGFVPTVRVGSDLGPSGQVEAGEDHAADLRGEHVTSGKVTGEWDDEVIHVDKDLWSFVDFNGPDASYTLRYAIVMEEETVELVAERLGCAKADLMRVNRLTSENLYPGQSLRIPSSVPAGVR